MALKELFTEIADSIRAKKGTTDLINATDFPSEIRNITTGIKLFSTIEEMQASEGNNINDLAVVYGNIYSNSDMNTVFQTIKFPQLVILPTAVTASSSLTFMPTTYNITLSPTAFTFISTTAGDEIEITYSSEDGISYQRTDGNSEIVTLASSLSLNFMTKRNWKDEMGYFMLIGSPVFNGIYKYTSNYQTNIYSTKNTNLTNEEKIFDLSEIPISINSYYHIFITRSEVKNAKLNIHKALDYVVYYINNNRTHSIITNNSKYYLTSYNSNETNYTKYVYVNNVLTNTIQMSATINDVVAKVVDTVSNTQTYYLVDEIPQNSFYYNTSERTAYYTTDSLPTNTTIEYQLKSVKTYQPQITQFYIAPSQLTATAANVKSGYEFYGVNGVEIGTYTG